MAADGWRELVLEVIHRAYRPGVSFTLQSLYQRVKGSAEFEARPTIDAPEATIRNIMNKLVKEGHVERLSPGRYRYH